MLLIYLTSKFLCYFIFDTPLLAHLVKTHIRLADELSSRTNIDDLERP